MDESQRTSTTRSGGGDASPRTDDSVVTTAAAVALAEAPAPDEPTGLELFDAEGPAELEERTFDGPADLDVFVGEAGLRPVQPDVWCRTCDAYHEAGQCPGHAPATGTERHGWRAVFETPSGRREVHGVLVAPSEGRWRARILTYPRILWTNPGGRSTIKFIAHNPQDAERRAIAFVLDHCKRRGHTLLPDEEAVVSVGRFDAESEQTEQNGPKEQRRKVRSVPIRFGEKQLTHAARTADLSKGGLFIATDVRISIGTSVRVMLELGACTMPLNGVVRWARRRSAPGRPRGLGLEIVRPPALYLDYVRQLP